MKASDLYDYDVSTVKQLGEHTVKVTYTSACRIKGMEDEAVHIAKCSVNTEKLNNNICRARSKVQEWYFAILGTTGALLLSPRKSTIGTI